MLFLREIFSIHYKACLLPNFGNLDHGKHEYQREYIRPQTHVDNESMRNEAQLTKEKKLEGR